MFSCVTAVVHRSSFKLIATDLERIDQDADKRLAHRLIERLGGAGIVTFTADGQAPQRSAELVRDTRAAVEMILRWAVAEEPGVEEVGSVGDIHAVRHRVVHGGEQFTKSVLINDEVLRGIEDCIELAPLHNPANIQGIVAASSALVWRYRKSLFSIPRFTKHCRTTRFSTRCRINSIAVIASGVTAFTALRIVTSCSAIASCAGLRATRLTSSRCTSATVVRSRRSRAATASTRRWVSLRWTVW